MAMVVGGLFVFFVSLYFAYGAGVKQGHSRLADDQAQLELLKGELARVGASLGKAEEGLIAAERQKQIQGEAYKQMNLAYANSERKNAVLGSRLDFYRSIISPEDGQSGPSIQGFAHDYKEGQLSFDITLVQAIKHKHQVRGNLIVTLFENELVTGRWPASSPRSVNYQYFQQVSGLISKSSIGDNAKIKVELKLQSGESVTRWFELGAAVGLTPERKSAKEPIS